MRTYIQTIVIILITALFFSCESDPIFEDFETVNDTLNIESIEDASATSNNRSAEEGEETNIEEDDIPDENIEEDDIPEGKIEEDDIPDSKEQDNTTNIEEDDIPDGIKDKDGKRIEEDDIPE